MPAYFAAKTHRRSMLAIGVSLSAIAIPQVAFGQSCTPDAATGICETTVETANQTVAVSDPTHLINLATGTTVTQGSNAPFLLIENRPGASLETVTLTNRGVPITRPGLIVTPHLGAVLVNSGAVDGDVLLQGGTYIAAGGTVSGRVAAANPAATATDYFINRTGGDALGVSGVIDPGAGLDVFIRSFSQSADAQLPASLPTNFELGGVEVLGKDTTVTLTNAVGTSTFNGLAVTGDGSIINRAVIDNISLAGTGVPPIVIANFRTRAVNYAAPTGATGNITLATITPTGPLVFFSATIGSALNSFTNEGTINGDVGLNTASFVNVGELNLQSHQQGSYIQGAIDSGLNFINRGRITMTDTGLRTTGALLSAAITASTALDATSGTPLSFLNDTDALIEGGVTVGGQASTLHFENRGTINRADNPNLSASEDPAVVISWSDFGALPVGDRNFASDTVEIANSGTIGGGVFASGSAKSVSFVNSGSITGPGSFERAVEVVVNSTADAEGNPDLVDGETFAFTNTGTIAGSVDLDAEVSSITVSNSGTINAPRSQGVTIFPTAQQGILIGQETILNSDLTFNNSGTIESADNAGAAVLIGVEAGDIGSGVAGADQASANVTVTNSGTLRTTGGAFLIPGQYQGLPMNTITVVTPVALGVAVDAEGTGTLTINNTVDGLIETLLAPAVLANPTGAVPLANSSAGAAIVALGSNVSITNDGHILSGNTANGALLPAEVLSGQTRIAYPGYGIVNPAEFEGVIGGAIDTFNGTDNVVNSATGVIVGGIALRQGNDTLFNGGSITGNVFMGSGIDRITNVGTITGNVSLGDGNDIYITQLKDYTVHNNGIIDGGQGGDTLILVTNNGGSLQDYAAAPRTNFEFVALGGDGTVTSTGDALLPVVQLAGNLTLAEGSVVNAGQTFAFRSDGTVPLVNVFTNRGTINGSVSLNLGNDTFANYGTLNGSLDLGEGDDSFVQGINAVFTGTADGGAGRDMFTLDINGGGRISSTLYDQLVNFEVLGLTGTGAIITDAPLPVETIELAGDGGTVSFGEDAVIQTQGDTAITGSAASDQVDNAGTINGNVQLGDGDNGFVNNGMTNGNVVSGTGSDNLGNGGTINGSVDTGAGSDAVSNTGEVSGSVDTGDGDDGLSNGGAIGGDVSTGSGSDNVQNAGSVGGSVDTGDGDDNVQNSGTIGGDVNLDGGAAPVQEQAPQARASGIRLAAVAAEVVPVSGGNDIFTSSGSIAGSVNAGAGDDSFTLSGSVGGSVDLGDDNDTFNLAATGTVAGSVDLGAGNDVFTGVGSIGGSAFGGAGADSFTLSGSVGQNVDLGDRDDILDLQGAWTIGGIATGGTGTDVLRLGSTGTEAAPRVLDLARFQAFEQLDVQSGVNALTGTGTFSSINVTAGRLIGKAGSVLTGNVVVAQAATFGSAGTVNGNIAVSGVLSPGASPATMTVNGNVALGATSTTVFEFTPTVSDALVINGSLAIASGAKLTLTGNRPITPGIYTMVSTTQGITGSFGANITRDNTVLGVLRQTSNAIELVGLFQLRAGANVQATTTKDYLNAVLVAGQASNGLIDAFPALLDADGFARPAQLATLSPEPYADAAQLGIENGLSIARALRQAPLTGRGESSGLFVFGQGYGSWREFKGDARGVSRADVDSYGFLGGIGYGNDIFGASLFVGRSDSRQRISSLGARNDADGLFAGGRLHFSLDGVNAGATLVFDRAEGDTSRAPAVGGTARSHYNLHGTTADAWIGYGLSVGGGWRVGPEVGVTSVSVIRGAISESGGGAFALNLRREHYDAVFLNGSLKLQGPETGRLRPWIAGGVRHRASGDRTLATASLAGTTQTFTVGGVERDRTVPHVGAGLAFDVGTNASVFVNGDAEFSSSNALQNVNAGVVFRF